MFADLLKLAVMSTLQARVSMLGVCPYCHTKTLVRKHEQADMAFNQCEKCLRVYVTAETVNEPRSERK